VRFIHLFVLLVLSNAASAQTIEGCAPATGPNDARAVQIARINAISAHVRANNAPIVSGDESVRDGQHSVRVSSATTGRIDRARVLRSEFVPGEGGPGKICVAVSLG
jgi:hypothetical protein